MDKDHMTFLAMGAWRGSDNLILCDAMFTKKGKPSKAVAKPERAVASEFGCGGLESALCETILPLKPFGDVSDALVKDGSDSTVHRHGTALYTPALNASCLVLRPTTSAGDAWLNIVPSRSRESKR